MPNEYLKEFNRLQNRATFRGQQWFGERKRLVEEYSWAVTDTDAVKYLANFDAITEIGAGNGYWAYCVKEEGGNVDAVDVDPPDETWTSVKEADATTMDLDDDTVLSVWPPADGELAYQVLRNNKPNHFVYVGGPRGGCTGSDKMFDLLEKQYGLVGKIDIPSYAGLDDNMYHYVRKR